MAIDQSMPPSAPSIGDFDYPDFYRAMVERERLQVARDEMKWTEKHQPPERKIEVLLNFGCNVRQTPHLMREAVAVLEVLGVDFHAVAGQQFCCGKPYSNNGLKDAARGVVEASVRRMASYEPETAIQWCSACEMQFADVVIPEVGIEFQSDGLAAFLVDKIDELGDKVPWKKDLNVRAAIHGHLGEHRVRDAHPPVTIELLKRIPGVEFVELANTEALNMCDNNGLKIAAITSDEYKAAQRRLEDYLAEINANTLVTLYHSCTRELSKFASDRLPIRHFISLVADALGVSKPDRFSEYWRLGETEKVVEASRRNWESWDYTEAEAYKLAHRYFVPSYAVNAPDCPCNGECTRTGASFLSAHKIDRAKDLPMVQAKDLV
jgi:Fe-S oxidoreductase